MKSNTLTVEELFLTVETPSHSVEEVEKATGLITPLRLKRVIPSPSPAQISAVGLSSGASKRINILRVSMRYSSARMLQMSEYSKQFLSKRYMMCNSQINSEFIKRPKITNYSDVM